MKKIYIKGRDGGLLSQMLPVLLMETRVFKSSVHEKWIHPPSSLGHIIRGKNFEMLLHMLCNSMSSLEGLKYTQRNQAESSGANQAQVSFLFVRAIFSSDLSHLGGIDA